MADALSTAFFAMSLEAVDEYCIRHPEVGAIIVPAGEGELEMHCFGTAVDYVNG
jgi:thiamine biosynthesis lipoprotein ApbE